MSAVVIDVTKAGKLQAVQTNSLPIPEDPKRGETVDGYVLQRSFTGTDRIRIDAPSSSSPGEPWSS